MLKNFITQDITITKEMNSYMTMWRAIVREGLMTKYSKQTDLPKIFFKVILL